MEEMLQAWPFLCIHKCIYGIFREIYLIAVMIFYVLNSHE